MGRGMRVQVTSAEACIEAMNRGEASIVELIAETAHFVIPRERNGYVCAEDAPRRERARWVVLYTRA